MLSFVRDPGLVPRVRRLSTKVNALVLPVILIVVCCPLLPITAEDDVFTDQFVLHHSGGPEQARQFAEESGFQYLDRVSTARSSLTH